MVIWQQKVGANTPDVSVMGGSSVPYYVLGGGEDLFCIRNIIL